MKASGSRCLIWSRLAITSSPFDAWFLQSRQAHPLQNRPPAKHSQYSFRHWDFLQWHRLVTLRGRPPVMNISGYASKQHFNLFHAPLCKNYTWEEQWATTAAAQCSGKHPPLRHTSREIKKLTPHGEVSHTPGHCQVAGRLVEEYLHGHGAQPQHNNAHVWHSKLRAHAMVPSSHWQAGTSHTMTGIASTPRPAQYRFFTHHYCYMY